MPQNDAVAYLNKADEESSPFFSKLIAALKESKQGKATVAPWTSMIKALTQKGVKQIELDESTAIAWLAEQDQNQVLTREELTKEIDRRYFTVKEVSLGSPKFERYRQPGGEYREYLYIANSERANVVDAIEEVEWQMEELSFEPERLAENPLVALQLENQRAALMRQKGQAIDFPNHHFSDKVEHGGHGKNLLAHCRVTIRGDIYFIEELQSDWAQRGRKSDWKAIPRGPLVTNTEAWAGLIMRRQMQVAASLGIKTFAWLTESMRNGGRQEVEKERADAEMQTRYRSFMKEETKRQLGLIGGTDHMTPEQAATARDLVRSKVVEAAQREGLSEPRDQLNDFYVTMIPKLVDKALGKSGGKTGFATITLGPQTAMGSYGSKPIDRPNVVTVPCVEITPEVREHLLKQQPMYSRAAVLSPVESAARSTDERARAAARALEGAREMLGTTRHIRFASHVYDIATGSRVAGRYVNKLIQIALDAKDIEEATDHECFHFAVDNLMTISERSMIERSFAPGSELNWRVRNELIKHGRLDEAGQCDSAEEAAAHGFVLWKRGKISMTERPVQGLFSDLINVVRDGARWIRRVVLEQRCPDVESLFESLAGGQLAQTEGRDSPAEIEAGRAAEAALAQRASSAQQAGRMQGHIG